MVIGPVAQERFTTAALDYLDAAMDAANQILFPGMSGEAKALLNDPRVRAAYLGE